MDPGRIGANFDNGGLELTVARKVQGPGHRKRIDIG